MSPRDMKGRCKKKKMYPVCVSPSDASKKWHIPFTFKLEAQSWWPKLKPLCCSCIIGISSFDFWRVWRRRLFKGGWEVGETWGKGRKKQSATVSTKGHVVGVIILQLTKVEQSQSSGGHLCCWVGNLRPNSFHHHFCKTTDLMKTS